jgi:hypothetical protein
MNKCFFPLRGHVEQLLVLLLAVVFMNLAPSQLVRAQTSGLEPSQCVDDNTLTEGLPLHSLKVKARGGWVPQIAPVSSAEPILVVGQPYTADKRTFTIRAVNKALLDDREQVDETIVGSANPGRGVPGSATKSLGVIAVLYTTACTRIVEGPQCGASAKCVDVEIQPYYLRLERTRISKLILPIPRSNRPNFFKQTPRALLAFNPMFGVNHDSRYGLSETVEISTDLLTLKPLLKGGDDLPAERNTKLNLNLLGRKSLTKPFYDADVTLSLKRRRPGKTLESYSLDGNFVGVQEPWGEGKYFRNSGRLGATLELRPQSEWLGKITASAAYRFSGNRFFSGDQLLAERTSENSFEGRAIIDGRIAGGLIRLGIWADSSSPKDFNSYQRVAGTLAYQKEFAVTLNQTLGVEVTIGAGRAFGDVPEYARFYGGNQLASFLYDETDDRVLASLPSGPLIRSFGKGQAGNRLGAAMVRGGTSYKHLNLNITLPIPGLSRPLIPAEQVIEAEDEEPGGTLKDVIKGQMNTAESSISVALQEQGLPFDDAQKEAAQIVKQIRPAVNFIADQANIFSIKPLLMFDVANLKSPGSTGHRTPYGVGGGLQLTIVVAKFEAGYMRTVRRSPGDPRGNFVMRLVFQNLF